MKGPSSSTARWNFRRMRWILLRAVALVSPIKPRWLNPPLLGALTGAVLAAFLPLQPPAPSPTSRSPASFPVPFPMTRDGFYASAYSFPASPSL